MSRDVDGTPLKAGDLVQVVKPAPCCGSTKALGLLCRVANTNPAGCVNWCPTCGRYNECSDMVEFDTSQGAIFDSAKRVKRVPPLSELVENEEEIGV